MLITKHSALVGFITSICNNRWPVGKVESLVDNFVYERHDSVAKTFCFKLVVFNGTVHIQ